MSNQLDPFPGDMRAGSDFLPVSPRADTVGVNTHADPVDRDDCSGKFLSSSAHPAPYNIDLF